MNRRIATIVRRSLFATAFVGALAAAGAACDQGEGDRCQTDDDCGAGLICNQATAVCANSSTSTPIDATTPEFIDAEQDIDAPIDAPDAPL